MTDLITRLKRGILQDADDGAAFAHYVAELLHLATVTQWQTDRRTLRRSKVQKTKPVTRHR